MKARIAIAIVFFVLGVIALDVYRNNFSHSSKVEKCADKKHYDWYEKTKKTSMDALKYWQNELTPFLKKSYSEKIKTNGGYRYEAEKCEDYAKEYPDLFKKQY